MSLRVIGAGFGRTGTLSLKSALETLGFSKTHHMKEVLASPRQMRLWHAVATGQQPQWDAIFDGYQASVDFPSASYWRELVTHYPDAKVVLSVRDPDSWYRSANETIHAVSTAMPQWIGRLVPLARLQIEMVNAAVWQRVFHGRFTDRTYAIEIFNAHIAAVRKEVPEDRLLVFEAAQGWAPLCAFLGCPIPDAPYPHLNDTQQFRRMVRILRAVAVLPVVIGAALLVALAVQVFV